MDFDSSMKISASGLTAHRVWMNVLSANLANMNNTRGVDGNPYRRKTVIYESAPTDERFDDVLSSTMEGGLEKVHVADVVPDGREFKKVYDPSHPDADKDGIVQLPNINTVEEMANLLNASRSYEANLAAMNTAKQLALKTLDISK